MKDKDRDRLREIRERLRQDRPLQLTEDVRWLLAKVKELEQWRTLWKRTAEKLERENKRLRSFQPKTSPMGRVPEAQQWQKG